MAAALPAAAAAGGTAAASSMMAPVLAELMAAQTVGSAMAPAMAGLAGAGGADAGISTLGLSAAGGIMPGVAQQAVTMAPAQAAQAGIGALAPVTKGAAAAQQMIPMGATAGSSLPSWMTPANLSKLGQTIGTLNSLQSNTQMLGIPGRASVPAMQYKRQWGPPPRYYNRRQQ